MRELSNWYLVVGVLIKITPHLGGKAKKGGRVELHGERGSHGQVGRQRSSRLRQGKAVACTSVNSATSSFETRSELPLPSEVKFSRMTATTRLSYP